jgi:hypothetical protein
MSKKKQSSLTSTARVPNPFAVPAQSSAPIIGATRSPGSPILIV